MTGTAYRVRPAKELTFESGPWVGMNDATQPIASDARHALLLQNLWARDVPHASYADGRPGFTLMGTQQGLPGNLALQSEALGTSPWVLTDATVTADTDLAPDGTTTADTITSVVSENNDRISQTITPPTGGSVTFSMYFKEGTSATPHINIYDNVTQASFRNFRVTWSGGVPTLSAQGGTLAYTLQAVTSEANSFYRIAVTVHGVVGGNAYVMEIFPSLTQSLGTTAIVWGVQIQEGAEAGTYVPTTTAAVAAVNFSQRHYQFTKLDGTELTVWFVGGKVTTYNWSTDAYSEPVTAANLTTAGIVLSTTARVYCVTFQNTLVVSDGVNLPWTWDGTSGAGGLVELTNAPVFYGQPVVYYGKLAAIKDTERNTWVWSEEGAANTGYEAGGYNNAWTLGQTEQEGFYAIAATDDAITFLRREGITQVIGRLTSDFQSTGTLDAVSQSVGTLSPAGVIVYDKVIYFVGSDQRFYKIVGSTLSEIAIGGRVSLGAASRVKLSNAVVSPWPEGNLLIFGIADTGHDYPNLFFAVNPENDELAGLFRGWRCTSLDAVKNGDGIGVLVHGGGASATVSTGNTAGYSYVHGNPDGVTWDDEFASGTVAVSHVVTPGFLGFDVRTDKHFYQVDASLLTPTDIDALTVSTETQRGTGSSNLTVALTGSGSTEWDNFDWDEADWAGVGTEQHVDAGLRSDGRWLKLTLGHSAIGERFQVQALLVRAKRLDQRARMT